MAEEKGFAWKPVVHEGLEYLPLSQVEAFYQLSRKKTDPPVIEISSKEVSLKFALNSREAHLNGVFFRLRHPVLSLKDVECVAAGDFSKLLDPVMRPRKFKGEKPFETVILDPWYGALDEGVETDLAIEAGMALDWARSLQVDLEGRGFEVILAREDQTDVPLLARAEIFEAHDHALIIGLKCQAVPGREIPGLKTIALNSVVEMAEGRTNDIDGMSVALACVTHWGLVRACKASKRPLEDLGIERDNPVVSAEVRHPSIIVELNYPEMNDPNGMVKELGGWSFLSKSLANSVHFFKQSTAAE